jgi:hypothetical protein
MLMPVFNAQIERKQAEDALCLKMQRIDKLRNQLEAMQEVLTRATMAATEADTLARWSNIPPSVVDTAITETEKQIAVMLEKLQRAANAMAFIVADK